MDLVFVGTRIFGNGDVVAEFIDNYNGKFYPFDKESLETRIKNRKIYKLSTFEEERALKELNKWITL